MGQVTLRGVRKSFGSVGVIKGIDQEVRDGEFLVFVRPSGGGKSTTLRMLAGLEAITAGELQIDGVRANHLRPSVRDEPPSDLDAALRPDAAWALRFGAEQRLAA